MSPLDRRELLSGALMGVAASALPCVAFAEETEVPPRPWRVIDTNISLFQWPFRRLRYDTPAALVEKLRSLRIEKAWAGSYEGLLHRDVGGVNLRLAQACREHGRGILVPFGTVNPTLPDWEEDLRRCHEDYKMPGVRLHPNYHGYTLDDPRFRRVLSLAAERALLVQLAASMEDPRTQHPKLQVPDVDLEPLAGLMKQIPGAKVLILNDRSAGSNSKSFASTPGVFFDMARIEGTDGVAKLVRGAPAGRVVFGSHAPFFIYESALIKVYESELTEAESRALFEQNATRLLSQTKQN